MTSGMRFTMHAAEVCTPSARSTRIFDGGLPSTVHIMCSASPSARMRNSICALAVGPSAVSTDATILRPSEVRGPATYSGCGTTPVDRRARARAVQLRS